MVSNGLDFGLNPQTAVNVAPLRADQGRYLAVETRFSAATFHELGARGHECHSVGDWMWSPQDGRSDVGRGSMVIRGPGSGNAPPGPTQGATALLSAR